MNEPGPDGTTIRVYSQRTGRQNGCLVAIVSTAGLPPSPALPALDHFGGCSGLVGTPGTIAVPAPPGAGEDASPSYTYGWSSGTYFAPDGSLYQVMVGQLSPTATRVVVTFGEGNT